MRYKSYERLIVHVDPAPTKTAGGIHLPETTTNQPSTLRGRVVASPAIESDDETYFISIEPGTRILFINGGSFSEGNTYFVKPENVLAILDEQA